MRLGVTVRELTELPEAPPRVPLGRHRRRARLALRVGGIDARRRRHRPHPARVARRCTAPGAHLHPVPRRSRPDVARVPALSHRVGGRRTTPGRPGWSRPPSTLSPRSRPGCARSRPGSPRDRTVDEPDLVADRHADRPRQLRARADPHPWQHPAPRRADRRAGAGPASSARCRRTSTTLLGPQHRRRRWAACSASIVGHGQAEAIARTAAVFGDLRERNPVELMVAVGDREVAFDAILHREAGGILLVELELASGPRPFSFPNTYLAVRGVGGRTQPGDLAAASSTRSPRVRCASSPASTA